MRPGPRPRPDINRALELRLRERIDQLEDRLDQALLARTVYRRRLYAMRQSRDMWRHRAMQR